MQIASNSQPPLPRRSITAVHLLSLVVVVASACLLHCAISPYLHHLARESEEHLCADCMNGNIDHLFTATFWAGVLLLSLATANRLVGAPAAARSLKHVLLALATLLVLLSLLWPTLVSSAIDRALPFGKNHFPPLAPRCGHNARVTLRKAMDAYWAHTAPSAEIERQLEAIWACPQETAQTHDLADRLRFKLGIVHRLNRPRF